MWSFNNVALSQLMNISRVPIDVKMKYHLIIAHLNVIAFSVIEFCFWCTIPLWPCIGFCATVVFLFYGRIVWGYSISLNVYMLYTKLFRSYVSEIWTCAQDMHRFHHTKLCMYNYCYLSKLYNLIPSYKSSITLDVCMPHSEFTCPYIVIWYVLMPSKAVG